MTPDQITVNSQFKKLQRALGITLRIGPITEDDYKSIIQLMSDVDDDVVILLDNTHENL